MSIFDADKYRTVFHDFDFLKGCFGKSRIMPSDIDGIVERNGNFLVMEFKPSGKKLPIGQSITFRKLAQLPKFTVVVIWHIPCEMHEPKEPVSMQVFPEKDIISADVDTVRVFVKNWWEVANARNPR